LSTASDGLRAHNAFAASNVVTVCAIRWPFTRVTRRNGSTFAMSAS
jgi:hypothetical protein